MSVAIHSARVSLHQHRKAQSDLPLTGDHRPQGFFTQRLFDGFFPKQRVDLPLRGGHKTPLIALTSVDFAAPLPLPAP